jgi:hypothetical protein
MIDIISFLFLTFFNEMDSKKLQKKDVHGAIAQKHHKKNKFVRISTMINITNNA